MVVYIVMGGYAFAADIPEGLDMNSTQVFATEREAREYGATLIDMGGFDWYDLVPREVPTSLTR